MWNRLLHRWLFQSRRIPKASHVPIPMENMLSLLVSSTCHCQSRTVSERCICYTFLSTKHWVNKCSSQLRYDTCSKKHHSLLHGFSTRRQSDYALPNVDASLCAAAIPARSNESVAVLLGTALVHILGHCGTWQTIRALIDSASQISAIKVSCSNRLDFIPKNWTAPISGLSGTAVVDARGTVECVVQPRSATEPQLKTKAWVLLLITSNMPRQSLFTSVKNRFVNLALADLTFHIASPIDVLLRHRCIHAYFGRPESHSRWKFTNCIQLDIWLGFDWASVSNGCRSPHFTTGILNRFDRKSYRKCLACWRTRNVTAIVHWRWTVWRICHMSVAMSPEKYFIPHHVVYRPVDGDNKIRVVFDASAKCYQGPSLNECLLQGPKLQQDIVDILIRFRVPKYLRQISVKWFTRYWYYRNIECSSMYFSIRLSILYIIISPYDQLVECELDTVTYGTNCALFLALRVLKSIAVDNCAYSDAARDALLNQTYVEV